MGSYLYWKAAGMLFRLHRTHTEVLILEYCEMLGVLPHREVSPSLKYKIMIHTRMNFGQ